MLYQHVNCLFPMKLSVEVQVFAGDASQFNCSVKSEIYKQIVVLFSTLG
jgi:hypothetical protein